MTPPDELTRKAEIETDEWYRQSDGSIADCLRKIKSLTRFKLQVREAEKEIEEIRKNKSTSPGSIDIDRGLIVAISILTKHTQEEQ